MKVVEEIYFLTDPSIYSLKTEKFEVIKKYRKFDVEDIVIGMILKYTEFWILLIIIYSSCDLKRCLYYFTIIYKSYCSFFRLRT